MGTHGWMDFIREWICIRLFFFWSQFSYDPALLSLTLLEITPTDWKHGSNSHPHLKSQNIGVIVWMRNLPQRLMYFNTWPAIWKEHGIFRRGSCASLRMGFKILLLGSTSGPISLLPVCICNLSASCPSSQPHAVLSWCVYHEWLYPSVTMNQSKPLSSISFSLLGTLA